MSFAQRLTDHEFCYKMNARFKLVGLLHNFERKLSHTQITAFLDQRTSLFFYCFNYFIVILFVAKGRGSKRNSSFGLGVSLCQVK